MTDFWKSQARKFCDFCKCWIADNRASTDFHENGKKHKENVQRRLKEIHKSSAKSAKQQKKFENDLQKMEQAAHAAYLKDIQSNNTDMMANELIHEKLTDIIERKYNNAVADVDPMDPYCSQKLARIETRKAKAFKEAAKKEKKSHEKDESSKETDKTDTVHNEKGNKLPTNKVWYEARSGGYSYYWNIQTNESMWEPPMEGFMSIAEQVEEAKEHELQEQFYKDMDKEKEQEIAEHLEEQRANAEREKMKEIRQQYIQEKKDESYDEDDVKEKIEESVNEKVKCVPLKAQPYGSWQVVKTIQPPKIDLQLPKIKDSIIAKPIVEEQPPQRTFKEKVITHVSTGDSDSEDSTISFKKRKFSNKNVRKRITDD